MDRRMIILTAAATAVLPAELLAQTKGGRDHELQHAAATLSYGAAALEASKIAEGKAGREDVKQFAQDEAAEQETVAAVLKAAAGDQHSTAPQARPKLEENLSAERLRSLSGAEFDRAFIDMQIAGHQQLLQAQETYLARGQDQTFRAIASLARGHIREHLGRLARIRQEIG